MTTSTDACTLAEASSLTFPEEERDRAEAIAACLCRRGYRRRHRGLSPGDVIVESGADGFVVSWRPLTWDLAMLNRLESIAGVRRSENELAVLRALSLEFPDRQTSLHALEAIELFELLERDPS